MSNRANEYPDEVFCPLVGRIIVADDCLECQAAANHELLPDAIPAEYRQNTRWREICMQCKYFETE